MTRRDPRHPTTRCPTGLQRFLTRASAEAFAAHNDRRRIAIACYCGGYHVRRATDEEIAAQESRRKAEREARVAAYLSTVPARGDQR